jgi:nucleoside diphosphate kinase
MALLRELFANQQAGLTMYLPDCAQSRLWGNLDHAIHAATGFQVVRRQWINHDINSIMRFYRGPEDEPFVEQDPAEAFRKYDSLPAETLQYGHLMVKLLMLGPSLVTIWRGENAIPALLSLKGKTQPAEAAAGSIRGGFWCDNGVCNLAHSSDDLPEVERELAALNLDHWLEEDAGQAPLIEPIPVPQAYAAHSGISVVCEVVNRVLIEGAAEPRPFCLPASGSARETNQQLTRHLRETAALHAATAPFIEAFLTGDLVAVTDLLKTLPVTRWEHFVIQCGAVNRDRWTVQ